MHILYSNFVVGVSTRPDEERYHVFDVALVRYKETRGVCLRIRNGHPANVLRERTPAQSAPSGIPVSTRECIGVL